MRFAVAVDHKISALSAMSFIIKSVLAATRGNLSQATTRTYSSAMVVAKKFVYVNRFVGEPKPSDFRLEEETLPALKSGGTCLMNIFRFEM